jgi:deoxyribodipyrimidine photolyase-related protein
MSSPKRIVLILGDQLDLKGAALKGFDFKTDEIVMIESIAEAQYVWSHKAKIALFLSAMRHFAMQLKELKYPLTYIQSSPLSIVETLKVKLIQEGVTDLICVEPGEWRLKQQIEKKEIGHQHQNEQTGDDDHSVETHIIKITEYRTKKWPMKQQQVQQTYSPGKISCFQIIF